MLMTKVTVFVPPQASLGTNGPLLFQGPHVPPAGLLNIESMNVREYHCAQDCEYHNKNKTLTYVTILSTLVWGDWADRFIVMALCQLSIKSKQYHNRGICSGWKTQLVSILVSHT